MGKTKRSYYEGKRVSFAICLFSLLFAGTICRAQSNSTIINDDIKTNNVQKYSQENIQTFIEAAFSPYISPNLYPFALPIANLNCTGSSGGGQGDSGALARLSETQDGFLLPDAEVCIDKAEFKRRYSWAYEYLFRENGMPRYLAINKWAGPVRVTLGYPNDLKPAVDASSDKPATVFLQDFAVLAARYGMRVPGYIPPESKLALDQATVSAISEINTTLPILRAATGLSVTYEEHEAEKPENFANVRIVIADDIKRWKTPFKKSLVMPAGQPVSNKVVAGSFGLPDRIHYEFSDISQNLLTAVRFTPISSQQVDGFVLPNADNTIGMAFCFINAKNDEATVRALVRECLLRSMGLPSAPRVGPVAALGLWNDQTSSLAMSRKWVGSSAEITQLDKDILRTLYRPEIKPGMSPQETLNILEK